MYSFIQHPYCDLIREVPCISQSTEILIAVGLASFKPIRPYVSHLKGSFKQACTQTKMVSPFYGVFYVCF